jgi:hypothetical protein
VCRHLRRVRPATLWALRCDLRARLADLSLPSPWRPLPNRNRRRLSICLFRLAPLFRFLLLPSPTRSCLLRRRHPAAAAAAAAVAAPTRPSSSEFWGWVEGISVGVCTPVYWTGHAKDCVRRSRSLGGNINDLVYLTYRSFYPSRSWATHHPPSPIGKHFHLHRFPACRSTGQPNMSRRSRESART